MAVLDPAQPLNSAFTDAISGALTSFLEDVGPRLCAIDPSLEDVTRLATDFTAGGKRLRPAFCFWARVAASGVPDDVDALVRAAASLDLLHVGILLHDDVMDDSDSRRGLPAAHRQFASLHSSHAGVGSSADYGRSAAIQIGNLLQAWSVELYEGSGLPNADRTRGRRYLDRMRTEVIGGQLLDMAAQGGLQTGLGPVELAEHVVEYKTARYTIQRPAQLGAALGAGSDELLSGLWRLGLPLGRAFQYRDDVLGVFGDEAATGKPSGDDLREGKRTVLVAEAMASSPAVASELNGLLGNPLDADELARARHLLVDSGALERTEARIDADYHQSLEIIDSTPMTDEGRTALGQLAWACVNRGV